MIPGAATDYFACGREAGIYYFGEKRWNESGVLIHNAIDLERFCYRSEVRTRLRRDYQLEDKLVIGSVARFMVQKNHTRMLEQFACLKKIYPNSHLLLAGEGELQAAMEEKAKRLGIYDSVSFLGVQKDTSIWYQAMDVFLMPSLFEGLPVVGIEAQASGLPCVFSDTITDEIILSDRAVRLSLEQPDEVWAKELIRLGTADRDRAEGRSVVRSAGYDIVEETKRLQEIYVSLIEK